MGDQAADEGREKEADCKDTMTATKTAAALFLNKCCGSFLRGYEGIHHDIVAEASGHDEEVENFVGAEELMLCIE